MKRGNGLLRDETTIAAVVTHGGAFRQIGKRRPALASVGLISKQYWSDHVVTSPAFGKASLLRAIR
jgi:hypothetical protein